MNIYHVDIYTVSKNGNIEQYFNSLVLASSKKKATIKALEEVEYYGKKELVIKAYLISDIEGKSIVVLDDDKMVVEKSVFENLRIEFKKAKDAEYESKILEHLKPTDNKLINLRNMLSTFEQTGDIDLANRVRKMIEIEESNDSEDDMIQDLV